MIGLSYVGATERTAEAHYDAWVAAGRPMQLTLPLTVESKPDKVTA